MDKFITRKNKPDCKNNVWSSNRLVGKKIPYQKRALLMKTASPFREQSPKPLTESPHAEDWKKILNGYTDNRKPIVSTLFSGYSFYFDGFLGDMTRLELVELVRVHGGDVEHFYSVSRVSIIIAKNMCFSKEQQYLKKPSLRVIDPQWILDCVEKKRLLAFNRYNIIRDTYSNIDQYLHSFCVY